MSETEPFWIGPISARFDLSKLLPASLPSDIRFETIEEVQLRSLVRRQVLGRRNANSHFAAECLADCSAGYYRCRQIICPICARAFRRWFAAEVLELFERQSELRFATLFYETYPAGLLKQANLTKIRDFVRQRLRRAGVNGGLVAGGIEAGYRAKHNDWIIHVHIAAENVDGATFEAIREAFRTDAVPVPMKVSPLWGLPGAAGYLLKFVTFHRPGEQTSGSRANPYPLPPGRLIELAAWWRGYEFADFIFLLGARRRGSKIVRLQRKENNRAKF